MSKDSLRFRPIGNGAATGALVRLETRETTMSNDAEKSDKTWAGKRDHATDPDQRSERRANLEDKGERQTRLEESAGLGAEGSISQGGSFGGELARNVGKQDEMKRATERPGGATRVTKADEKDG